MGYEYIDMSIGGYEFQWVMNIAAPCPHIYRTCTIYQFTILINIYAYLCYRMDPFRGRPPYCNQYKQSYTEDQLKWVIDLVLVYKWGLQKAAAECGVPKSTLEQKSVG